MSDISYEENATGTDISVEENDTDPAVTSHKDLSDRDAAEQHTIGAIKGLTEALKDANRLKSGQMIFGDNVIDLTNGKLNLPDFAKSYAGVTWVDEPNRNYDTIKDALYTVELIDTTNSYKTSGHPFGDDEDYQFILETWLVASSITDQPVYMQRATAEDGRTATRYTTNDTFSGVAFRQDVTSEQLEKATAAAASSGVSGIYTTAEWGPGIYEDALDVYLDKGTYLVFLSFQLETVTAAAMKAYIQMQLRGGNTSQLGNLLFYDSNSENAANRVGRSCCTLVRVSSDNTKIYPYIHTNVAAVNYKIGIDYVKLGVIE